MEHKDKYDIHTAADLLSEKVHLANAHWWKDNDGIDIRENPLTFSNKLMLIVTEVAEACEGDRKELMDDKLPHRQMREVELADVLLRVIDLAAGFGLDLAGAVVEKMEYNAKRADHKIENRKSNGGKKF